MTTVPHAWRTPDVRRAIRAAAAAGLDVTAVDFRADGFRLLTRPAAPAPMAAKPEGEPDGPEDEVARKRAQLARKRKAEGRAAGG